MTRKTLTKTALSISIFLLIVWCLMGATSTLAWFTVSPDVLINSLQIGELNLELYHRVDTGNGHFEYRAVDESTHLFNDEALYEPGYTEVVYLMIENAGNVDFDYRFAVTESDYYDAVSVLGNTIHLANYLRFGVIFGSDEAALKAQLEPRDAARSVATTTIGQFCQPRTRYALSHQPGSNVEYAALVIYMPEDVVNVANYRGEKPPRIELGVNVLASQAGTIDRID